MTAIHLNPVAVSSVALLRAIRAGGWSNQKELAQAAGRGPKNIARDLAILRNADLLADSETIALSDIGDLQLDAIERAEGRSDEPGLPGGDRFPWQVGDIRLLRHSEIRPDPDNARRDWDSDEAKEELDALREDIIQVGLLQNLVVRPGVATGADGDPVYTLVGGERRWRAIGLAIFDDDWPADRPIPCRVVDLDELGHRLTALSENLQRRDLNPLEKARAFDALAKALADQGVDDGKINREIADRVGVTIEHIQQTRSLLKLDAADQERLALAKDDPRRLKVSEARKAVAAAAKTDAEREALLAVPMDSRLALAEVLHAISVQGRYSYDSIIIRPGAATTATGQDLVERGWLRFEGPLTYQWGHIDNLGHFAVARGQSVPSVLGEPYWTGTPETREAALRATQAEAGHPDRTDYVTDWLNGPFELTEEGQAIISEAAARTALREQALAHEACLQEKAQAEQAAAAERQRVVAAQSRDLFAAHRN
ncbi:MAG TPA: ParB/RepB/Spo0J family partition protein, partial [Brevundimonas sp.]|nr:ParB/RepB/Spo0J family partition protein [Brevundimonas sp.]